MNILNEASNSQTRSLSPYLRSKPTVNREEIQLIKDLAADNKFNQVEVKIDGKIKKYSPIYNWFNFENEINSPSQKKLKFECLICEKSFDGALGKPGNLLKHLKIHVEGEEWANRYDIFKEEAKFKPRKLLDKKQLNLVKFFITSNVAMQALENKYLRDCLQFKLSKYSFKKVILPKMIAHMKNIITNKLVDAKYITLITDIWTNKSVIDYLALGASIINTSFLKEILIIGMVKMPGAHNAENVKKAIEMIINKLKFNKAKISAIVTDEGSNLLRDIQS